MLAVETKPSPVGNRRVAPLPLENGEFVHSHEFLRRHEHMPWMKEAELIEGVVCLGSRATAVHAKADGIMQGWLVTYASHHPETEALTNTTVILGAENTVQPVAPLRRLPVAPLLSGVTAKVLAALAEHETPQASVKSQN